MALTAYRKWNFRVTDVSRAFLSSEPLWRDTYVKLPDGVEEEISDWEILKPLYGMRTACKDWYDTIRDFLSKECGSHVASLDKSAFF